ncbi:MAG: AAA family ATPase [Methylococcaceae bacterium]|nr:AAA family ATPase [Methylococcaceae bacterium]
MKSLQFKRLVLVSDTTKSASQFEFQPRFNLITGKNNSIGKTTLVQNLFWAIGCEPDFDGNWKLLNCKTLLEFSVSDQQYIVIRNNDTMVLGRKNGSYAKYYKITGQYSETIANLLEFKARLPNRVKNPELETPELETPPPAYYFLPFYIDQLRSWSAPWNSFLNLGQYANWKPTIVKYHTGYLSPEFFELEEKVFELKGLQRKAEDEVKRINTALEVVQAYVPENNLALSEDEFQEITLEIENELGSLAKEQEIVLNELTSVTSSTNIKI